MNGRAPRITCVGVVGKDAISRVHRGWAGRSMDWLQKGSGGGKNGQAHATEQHPRLSPSFFLAPKADCCTGKKGDRSGVRACLSRSTCALIDSIDCVPCSMFACVRSLPPDRIRARFGSVGSIDDAARLRGVFGLAGFSSLARPPTHHPTTASDPEC